MGNEKLPPLEYVQLVGDRTDDYEKYRFVAQHLFDLIRTHCNVKPNDRILDLGCGCGRVAAPFTNYLTTGTYDGIDVVMPMIQWCRDNITTEFPNFRFHHADVKNTWYHEGGSEASQYRFPFSDDSFDVVFAASLFTHLIPASAMQYAKETARVLKPSGRALLTFFIMNDDVRGKKQAGLEMVQFPSEHDGYYLSFESNPEAVIAYEERKVREILTLAGLRLQTISFGSWSYNDGWTGQDACLVTKAL